MGRGHRRRVFTPEMCVYAAPSPENHVGVEEQERGGGGRAFSFYFEKKKKKKVTFLALSKRKTRGKEIGIARDKARRHEWN